ncbi:hypothetical protein TNCT_166631 [Trichonephila clavata]|uniref:Uncharacterized protein n=1 Tax=Trichonephila clavata TaxID=2740835 RepID=A0A8X6L990_TRICU|nr:hypothetical protein TNCT_166631 [Trichonephila clavata]
MTGNSLWGPESMEQRPSECEKDKATHFSVLRPTLPIRRSSLNCRCQSKSNNNKIMGINKAFNWIIKQKLRVELSKEGLKACSNDRLNSIALEGYPCLTEWVQSNHLRNGQSWWIYNRFNKVLDSGRGQVLQNKLFRECAKTFSKSNQAKDELFFVNSACTIV